MTPIPTSSRWILAYALALAGCASGGAFATTDSWPDEPRPGTTGLAGKPGRPDGVAIDPLSAQPTGSAQGRTGGVGPVALVAPLPTSLAVRAVMEFFDAVVREDATALGPLIERGFWSNPSLGGRGRVALPMVFTGRFRGLEYQKLAGLTVVRESELEVYGEPELAHPLPGRPARPVEMTDQDVLVRAHVVTPRVGADRLFADELTFVLRPDGQRFRIALLLEDFQLP